MKVSFDKVLIGINGEQVKDEKGELKIGKLLAPALAGHNQGDPLKFWFWAKKIWDNEELELDPSDEKVIKDFVTTTQGLTNLVKGQILDCFKAE